MNDELINVTDVEDFDEDIEVTDLVPMDDESEESEGISAGEVAIGGLALIGAGFLIKKAFDGGKWLFNKGKNWLASKKDPDEEAPEESGDEPGEANEEAAETESVPEKEPPKGKGKK